MIKQTVNSTLMYIVQCLIINDISRNSSNDYLVFEMLRSSLKKQNNTEDENS